MSNPNPDPQKIAAFLTTYNNTVLEFEDFFQKSFTMNEEVFIESDNTEGEKTFLAIRIFTDGAVTVMTRPEKESGKQPVVVFDSKNSMSHELRAHFKFIAWIKKNPEKVFPQH